MFAGTPADLDVEAGVGVEAADNGRLAEVLTAAGAQVSGVHSERLRVQGLDPEQIGRAALEARIPLRHLAPEKTGLEQRFLELVDEGENE